MLTNPLNPNPNVVTDVNHIDGIFRGIVEDNDDPLNLCRLRVRVPYLNGMPDSPKGIPTDGLPWAAACVPYGGPGYGQVLIPEVGSTVWVMFENQAKDRPVWIGCSYGAQSLTGKRELKSVGYNTFVESEGKWTYDANSEDTPDKFKDTNKNSKVVIRTPKGFEISIDEADEHECLELVDRTGQIIRMYCPVTKEGNKNNGAVRAWGSVMDNDINEGILEYAMEELPRDMNYILIESQSNDNNIQSSYIRLSKSAVRITDGESVIDMQGKNMTFDNGFVRSVYSGDTNTYVITNSPGSTFQMDVDKNSITHGSSEIVIKDDVVEIDNGRVGIRLTDAIELCGPIRFGSRYGRYGGFINDDWLRIYYPHIKLATGESSIILDGKDITISGDTKIASGRSSITVDDDIKLSGDTDVTNNEASITLRDNKFSVDSHTTKLSSGESSIIITDTENIRDDEIYDGDILISGNTKIASGQSSIIVTNHDKLGTIDNNHIIDDDQYDGDIIISGDTKIATGESSVIVTDREVDVSTNYVKVANNNSSIILHNNYIETNNMVPMVDPEDEAGQVHRHPDRILDIGMEDVHLDDVSMEDTSIEVKIMDSIAKGDVSIDDYYYNGWYYGQHVNMLPVQ